MPMPLPLAAAERQQPAIAAPHPRTPSSLVEAGPLPPRALPVRLHAAGGGLLRRDTPSAPPSAPPATVAPHPPARVAHPGQQIVRSNRRDTVAALLQRKLKTSGGASPELLAEAARLGIVIPSLAAAAPDLHPPSAPSGAAADPTPPPPPAPAAALHLGSSRPHAQDGDDPEHARQARWARRGSIRRLEPELPATLRDEPMPRGNVVKPTAWEPPPERPAIVPGPFSTEELIPTGVVPAVTQHGESIASCLERAERGPEGWRVARGLRPEPLIYTHEEALNPCGRGFSWLQREGVEVWDTVILKDYRHLRRVLA